MLMAAYTKLYLDHRRSMRITAEMMADLYSHDLSLPSGGNGSHREI